MWLLVWRAGGEEGRELTVLDDSIHDVGVGASCQVDGVRTRSTSHPPSLLLLCRVLEMLHCLVAILILKMLDGRSTGGFVVGKGVDKAWSSDNSDGRRVPCSRPKPAPSTPTHL